ncbi:MAG: anti-sigma factor [Nocardioidaceae bacterium]
MNADVHALAGAYAMDALPAEEAAAFAEHVEQCPSCQQEVAELQVTAAQLGLAAATAPPAELRDRVLHAVQQTRQIPPQTPTIDSTRRRARSRPRLLAAAAAVVLILGAGLLALRPLLDTADPPQRDSIVAVMDAPDARSSTTRLSGGGSMTVVSSRELDQAVVLGERLPRLDRDHDYQLWLVDRTGAARSANVLFDGSGEPATGPNLVAGLQPGDQVAITQEPAGGSEQPTTTPLAITRRT